jgi:hypothetical protein
MLIDFNFWTELHILIPINVLYMEPLNWVPRNFCNLIELTFGLVLGLVFHNVKPPIFLVLKEHYN